MTMPRKLIIDADSGIGDALAVILALCDPEIELLAVTATGGMVSGEQATRNLLALVSLLDPPRWPRFGISDGPVAAWSGLDTPPPTTFHGPNGLGDFPDLSVDFHQKHDSAKVMIDLVRANPNEITILTLGPLTNLFRAAELSPTFLGELRGLVVQGGAYASPGDVTPTAEFNILADPEAARYVLRQPCTKTLVPLDVTRRLELTFEQYQRLNPSPETRLGQALVWMLPFALRAARQHLGQEGVALHEVLALAAITQPELFDRESGAIDVELDGRLTRGMTVFDRRGIARWQHNIDVLTNVETQGVMDYCLRILQPRLNPS